MGPSGGFAVIGVQVTTEPTEEPISVAQAKAYLKVDTDDEDDDVSAMLTEAREAAESECHRAFCTQTLTLTLDDFPWGEIRLPRPPLQSVTWVKYYNEGNTNQLANVASCGKKITLTDCTLTRPVGPVLVAGGSSPVKIVGGEFEGAVELRPGTPSPTVV